MSSGVLSVADSLSEHTLAATIGMFDGVHLGHATVLAELRRQASLCGLKTAVVTFREHPQNVLGHPETPLKFIMPVGQRVEAIKAMGIDYVILLDFTRELAMLSSSEFMRWLHCRYGMDMLMVGYDHHFGHDRSETFANYVQNGAKCGVRVVKAPEYRGQYAPVSSSIIRRLILSGKVDDAMHCLGHSYVVSGIVVHGYRNGRKIGFPTANLGRVDETVLLPHNGAYAAYVTVLGRRWQAMVNVGRRPTLDNGRQLSIEANIFDFDCDIYGEPMTVEFVRFLRLEIKLGSIDELQRQLESDRETARRILSGPPAMGESSKKYV